METDFTQPRVQAMRKHARSEHEEADIFKEIGILYLRQGNLNAVRALSDVNDVIIFQLGLVGSRPLSCIHTSDIAPKSCQS